MTRYGTRVEDGTVYVEGEDARVAVGDLEDIVDAVGGPAWTITYTEAEKARLPASATADEGLTIDVVDAMHAMTCGERFVRTLEALPLAVPEEGDLSPRTGLFVGKLMENLENGVD